MEAGGPDADVGTFRVSWRSHLIPFSISMAPCPSRRIILPTARWLPRSKRSAAHRAQLNPHQAFRDHEGALVRRDLLSDRCLR